MRDAIEEAGKKNVSQMSFGHIAKYDPNKLS